MKIEEIKTMLRNFKYNKMTINKRQLHLENLKEIIIRASKRNDELSVAVNKRVSQTNIEKLVEEAIMEENILCREIQKIKELEVAINNLNQPSKTILLSRYILDFTFDEIAKDLFYSTKRIYQLHSQAVQELKEIFELQNAKEV